MARHRARVVDFGSRKIHAIKLARDLSGLGLKDAKDVVERGGYFDCEVTERNRAAIAEAAAAGIALSFDPPLGAGSPTPSSPPRTTATGEVTVRYGAGPKKIMAIKLARELTGLGLKDAKNLVEQNGVIRSGISRHEADAIAARFAEFDSTVKITAEAPPPWSPAPTKSPSTSAPEPFDPYGPNTGGFDPYAEDDDDF